MKIENRNGRTYIGDTTYLTARGEAVLGVIKVVATITSVILIAGLFNVNVLTPEECRAGILTIKDTPSCDIYFLEI